MTNNVFILFFKWFVAIAPKEILKIGRNFLFWGWHFFSIGYFTPRLFAPWHRDITSYGRGFDLERFLHVFGWNLISRVIGAVLRIFVMAAGAVVEVLIFFITVSVFAFWFAIPLIIPTLAAIGFLTLKI